MTTEANGFIRLPRIVLEALLKLPLNGTQWRILFWVIRQTYGWHVNATRFSWYQIAKTLGTDRGGTVRCGNALVSRRILRIDSQRVSLESDSSKWQRALRPQEKTMKFVSDDMDQRKTMQEGIACDDTRQPIRGRATALFRRAKERSKEKEKKYRNTRSELPQATRHSLHNGALGRHHASGAARPIPGKYGCLGQNR